MHVTCNLKQLFITLATSRNLMKKTFFQLVRYVGVGATATGADYGSYYLLTRAFGLGVYVSNPLAYLAGNVISFLGHRFITFRSAGKPFGEYVRFLCVTAVGLGISQLAIWVSLSLGFHDLVAKALAVIVSGCFNYLANRFWTFRAKRRP
jgi:dolichol-phosphate mannosyltransferase